jgi:hypothetical protein
MRLALLHVSIRARAEEVVQKTWLALLSQRNATPAEYVARISRTIAVALRMVTAQHQRSSIEQVGVVTPSGTTLATAVFSAD